MSIYGNLLYPSDGFHYCSMLCNQKWRNRSNFQVKAVKPVAHEEVRAMFLHRYSAYFPYFGKNKLAYDITLPSVGVFCVSVCVPSLKTFERHQRFSWNILRLSCYVVSYQRNIYSVLHISNISIESPQSRHGTWHVHYATWGRMNSLFHKSVASVMLTLQPLKLLRNDFNSTWIPEPNLKKRDTKTKPHKALSAAHTTNISLRAMPKTATTLLLDVDIINLVLFKHPLHPLSTLNGPFLIRAHFTFFKTRICVVVALTYLRTFVYPTSLIRH
jgi:hypothetical protein